MQSNIIYRLCRRYVNHINGENNSDIRTNGEMRWLREALPHCVTVFDVGANIGEWAILCLQTNPMLRIYCFEPSQVTYDRLATNLNVYLGRATLNPFGLGATAEVRSLHCFGEGAGTNSLYQREGLTIHQTKSEIVRLETLDQYCQTQGLEQIDLLKIDVEGHELDVLKGAQKMLQLGKIARIQFEYGGTFIDARILLKDMFDFLIPFGYQFYKIFPKRLKLAERYEQRFENFQYQNWVALKSGTL